MTLPPRSTFNAFAGIWPTPANKSRSFQIFYKHRGAKHAAERAGWYWRTFPYDELTGNESGPFTSSRAAFRDACANC